MAIQESKAVQAAKALEAARAAASAKPPAAPMPAQTSLAGARAQTATPQAAPPQVNANMVNTQSQGLQSNGMAPAQAVNQAATNPTNSFAKGGAVDPPSPSQIAQQNDAHPQAQSDVEFLASKLRGANALTEKAPSAPAKSGQSSDSTEQMLKDYEDPKYQALRSSLPKSYAKGGDVHETMKNMPLKDIIKLLASHPGLAGEGAGSGGSSMSGGNMAKGGHVMPGKASSHSGAGLMSMNADISTYAAGGPVAMDSGGSLEADSIVSYAPDGTPIQQNANGTEQYGNIDQLLGRPDSASTLGTGANPSNKTTQATGNMIGNTSSQSAAGAAPPSAPTTAMAKGGEEAPPPGSLSKEVADDVPAKLSEGEFVFSADAVRFFGLQKLTAMMDYARGELSKMAGAGTIRSPGDGKNPGDPAGQFMQDQKPNMDAYGDTGHQEPDGDEGDAAVTGLLKECSGGANMATGGPVEPGNVDLNNRPVVHNSDGTISTVRSMSFNEDGKEVLVPTISPDGKTLNTQEAIKLYHDTGQHLGKFNTTEEANKYAQQLHEDQAKEYQGKKKGGLVNMATGGGISEETFARGGIVGTEMASLAPKKNEGLIPSGIKLPTQGGAKGTGTENYGLKKLTIHAAKGGAVKKDYNGAINKETGQSYIGS